MRRHVLAVITTLLCLGSLAYAVRPPGQQHGGGAFVFNSPMAPSIPLAITVAATTSAGLTFNSIDGGSAGTCWRISCSGACSYRVTQGASTATANDNQLAASQPERFCEGEYQDSITFYNAGGSSITAYAAVVYGSY